MAAGLVACDHAKEHAALKDAKEKSVELDATLGRLAEEAADVASGLRGLGFDGDKMEKTIGDAKKQLAKAEADKKRLEEVVAGLREAGERLETEHSNYRGKYLKL